MKVVTESFLRHQFRKGFPDTFNVEGGCILTPSAAQLLAERGVKVEHVPAGAVCAAPASEVSPAPAPQLSALRFQVAGGGMLAEKPCHMTLLRGEASANVLVDKDHPRVMLRGALETLQAKTLLLQHKAHELGRKKLVEDLGQLLGRLEAVALAECMEHALLPAELLNLTEERLQEEACHLAVRLDYTSDEMALCLNELPCMLHYAESMAVKTFRKEFILDRPDIVRALNLLGLAVKLLITREAGKNR